MFDTTSSSCIFGQQKNTEVRGQKKSSSLRKCGRNGKRVGIIRTDEGVFKVYVESNEQITHSFTTLLSGTALQRHVRERVRERERVVILISEGAHSSKVPKYARLR